ncbi:uncharacterized protein LOC135493593 [Lineus longissimus]|uniref:uncharacterized protein LOC135493593 n=1 Tax=Lineus longissimus TaxID=88925 RepID=UPI00315DC1F0
MKELHLPITASIYWTDSTTVLRYLKNVTKRFKSFVANRISEILETTNSDQWRYIPTHLNPADCCSRGMKAAALCADEQWKTGPTFLRQEEDTWPRLDDHSPLKDVAANDPEVKNVINAVTTKSVEQNDGNGVTPKVMDLTPLVNPLHYSSWHRLIMRTAWLNRAICNLVSVIPRFKMKPIRDVTVTVSEYQGAVQFWIRSAQHEMFPDEIGALANQEAVGEKSQLAPLTPCYDETLQVLRTINRHKIHRLQILQWRKHSIKGFILVW